MTTDPGGLLILFTLPPANGSASAEHLALFALGCLIALVGLIAFMAGVILHFGHDVAEKHLAAAGATPPVGPGVMVDGPTYSDDAILGQAYQVARGVRALAIIGSCPSQAAQDTYGRLRSLGDPPAIPFVIGGLQEWATFGYASHAWVLDLLVFSESFPVVHRDRVLGLLLGYSPDAIRSFEENHSGCDK